jgi:glycosyltransferase involved in cell wall biosynthesis
MSSAQDLWMENLTRTVLRPKDAAYCRLELQCMLQAGMTYAPSQYLADYFQKTHGIKVEVVRPPAFVEVEPVEDISLNLPPRYLIFFGKLMKRKGSDLVAKALPIAWKHAPGLTMVWAGRETSNSLFADYRRQWGSRAKQVHWLGALKKPALYSVLSRSDASVLPSRVDNLPNTVIESLMFKVPVIGSRGASIDELVEDGRSGELVEIGDVDALARAMVRAWRGEAQWLGEGFQRPAILDQMNPKAAAENLIDVVMNKDLAAQRKAA